MDGVDEPCSPTPPTGQHQHQKRTFDALQKPDIFTCSRQASDPASDPDIKAVGASGLSWEEPHMHLQLEIVSHPSCDRRRRSPGLISPLTKCLFRPVAGPSPS